MIDKVSTTRSQVSHAQPRTTTRSHAQPRAATRSHAQPRATTRSHAQPRAATRSHAQPRAVCAAILRGPLSEKDWEIVSTPADKMAAMLCSRLCGRTTARLGEIS